jgi:hypothetical protein
MNKTIWIILFVLISSFASAEYIINNNFEIDTSPFFNFSQPKAFERNTNCAYEGSYGFNYSGGTLDALTGVLFNSTKKAFVTSFMFKYIPKFYGIATNRMLRWSNSTDASTAYAYMGQEGNNNYWNLLRIGLTPAGTYNDTWMEIIFVRNDTNGNSTYYINGVNGTNYSTNLNVGYDSASFFLMRGWFCIDNFKIWEGGLADEFVFDMPILSNINLTSGNRGGDWTEPYRTNDTTPTFSFNTNINANCSIGNQNLNWSKQNRTRDCSSGQATTSHICTITAEDLINYNISNRTVYFACINSLDWTNQTSKATAGGNVSVYSQIVSGQEYPFNRFYNYSSSSVNISFICNSTSLANIKNISLYLTNSANTSSVLNKTKSYTTGTNQSISFGVNLTNGDYTWSCLSYDYGGWYNWTDNRTLLINYTYTPDYSNVSVTLDGLNKSRKYEYDTTAQLAGGINCTSGTNCTICFDIYDDTDRYINYSCSSTNYTAFNYTIDLLRLNKFNNNSESSTITEDTTLSISLDNKTELYNIDFDLEGSAGNITLNISNSFVTIGMLIGKNEYTNKFIYDSAYYTNHNISFTTAGTNTIYLNVSAHGNFSNRTGFLNFTMKGFDIDAQNEFHYSNNFSNVTDSVIGKNNSYGTETVITYDNFLVNDSRQTKWTGVLGDENGYNTYSEKECKGLSGDPNYNKKIFPACYESYSPAGITYFYPNELDFRDVNYFYLEAITYNSCGDAEENGVYIELADGNSTPVILESTVRGTCGLSSTWTKKEINMTGWKISDTSWLIKKEIWSYTFWQAQVGGPSVKIVSVYDSSIVSTSGLNSSLPYKLNFRENTPSGSNSKAITLGFLNVSGIALNRTNTSYYGVENTLVGNYTTITLNTTTDNIARAVLNATAITPSGTELIYYLSNDNGTTWESVTNGETHTFSSTGSSIKAKFHLNSTINYSTPIIHSFKVDIIPSSFTGLDVYVGNSTSPDMELGPFNSTNSPKFYNKTDIAINGYLQNNCNKSDITCLVPITFISDSAGQLEVSSLNLTEDINPINLNYLSSTLDLLNNISFVFKFNGTNITMDNLKFDYRGSKNITVKLKKLSNDSIQMNYTIVVRYSKFNMTFPSGQDYWQIFPSKRNQSKVEPYGQNKTDGIWRIANWAYEDNINIYARYNESINASCVSRNLFAGSNYLNSTNSTKRASLNISLNTSNQLLVFNMSNKNITDIWTYTDINCSGQSSQLIIPIFCFNSICSECVRTFDFEDTCYWEE